MLQGDNSTHNNARTYAHARTHARAHAFGCRLKITFLDALENYSNVICMASNEPLFFYT